MLALLGLVACGADLPVHIPPDPPRPSTLTDQQVAERPRVSPLIIIGGGASGTAAALTAAESGVVPLVLEREEDVGGAGLHASNWWAVETPQQTAQGIDDDVEVAIAEWADITGGDPADPLVEAFVRESADVLGWVEGLGATVSERVSPMSHTGSAWRVHKVSDQAAVFHTLEDQTELCLRCEVQGISPGTLRRWRVTYVDHERDDTYLVETDDLIVASGGFARSLPRVLESWPELDGATVYYEAFPGMDGVSLDLLEQAGAALGLEHALQLSLDTVEDPELGWPEVGLPVGLGGAVLYLDSDGSRVLDPGEDWSRPGETTWMLLPDEDDSSAKINSRGFNYSDPGQKSWTVEEWNALTGLAARGSLDEIAAELGWDADALQATVARYNALTGDEEDPDLGEDLSMRTKLDAESCWLLPLVTATSKSLGGAVLSAEDFQVLDDEGQPMPGLYAVGEAAGMLGGIDLAFGFNGSITAVWWSGRTAARAILE